MKPKKHQTNSHTHRNAPQKMLISSFKELHHLHMSCFSPSFFRPTKILRFSAHVPQLRSLAKSCTSSSSKLCAFTSCSAEPAMMAFNWRWHTWWRREAVSCSKRYLLNVASEKPRNLIVWATLFFLDNSCVKTVITNGQLFGLVILTFAGGPWAHGWHGPTKNHP